jgi:predicted house-cleaning NTP pyrophosphatase (Maf/HAM1 superfamily)
MTARQISRYAATGEPLGKAGAYAIQGRASVHITQISGVTRWNNHGVAIMGNIAASIYGLTI